ncbi:Na+/H+ antiporter NhaA [Microterricola viridarii]|uniref:Na+/H+ antiporter NhaA n=1 Tax=Microterricola viridarii TaxID=412690 RepID=UPI0009ECA9FC|nr:Na+/H+ antiporter NhaA [Microterricola viridarii]
MAIFRSERYAAMLLLGAAVLGLILANSAIGPALLTLKTDHIELPWLGLDISLGHFVSDGLLAIFFFIVAVELKRELAIGELNSLSKAALPAIAAFGGVLVPAGIYLLITAGSGWENGWPVPTATDIAFALGLLAIFGKGIPTRVRVFLMALAVLDDLVAILIIAFFFTSDVQLSSLGYAAVTLLLFSGFSRLLRPRSSYILSRKPQWPLMLVMWVLAVLTWYFVFQSGVHATIAGVLLGLVMSRRPGGRAVHAIEPYSNGLILPLFAFSAALVAIPAVSVSQLSPAFWGILVALPVGKLLGITLAGWLSGLVASKFGGVSLKIGDLLVVASLGGVGFTVSLLMNELAFASDHEVVDEGTIAVLLGSAIAMVFSAAFVSWRAAQYRAGKIAAHPHDTAEPESAPLF